MVAQNLCPNPACASGTTHWDKDDSGVSSVTPVSGLASPFPRSTGVKWVITSGGNSQTARANIPAGSPVSAGVWLSANKSVPITCYLDSYTAQDGGTYITEAASDSDTLTTTPKWVPITGGTVPAGASWVGITVMAGVAATITATACRFVEDSTIDEYFDGDSSGWVWDGTTGASTSHASPAVAATGTLGLSGSATTATVPGVSATGTLGLSGSASTGAVPAVSVTGTLGLSGTASMVPHIAAAATLTLGGSATVGALTSVTATGTLGVSGSAVVGSLTALAGTGNLSLTATASVGVVAPPSLSPSSPLPGKPRARKAPKHRLCLVETTTGHVVADLPFTGNPTWSRQLNATGALSNVVVPLQPRLDADTLTMLRQYWRYSLVYAYGNSILQIGAISNTATDDTQTTPVMTVTTTTMLDFFSKKRIVFYYGHGLTDAAGNVEFSPTSPDSANQNLSWGSVARRLVEIAIGGPGANGPGSDNTAVSPGLSLPILLPDPVAGTATITYAIADLAPTGQRLTEITQLDGAPEIEFSPEWSDDTHTYVRVRMRISDTRLGQLGYPWAWDYKQACQSFALAEDATAMTFESIAKGQDDRQGATASTPASGSLVWGYSSDVAPDLPNQGWPWLITADTAHSSETDATVLTSYANADVRTNQNPVSTATMVIRNDASTINGALTGSPTLELLSVGDTAAVALKGYPSLPDGIYGVRILSMGQGPDNYTTTVNVQLLGAAQ